MMPQPLAATVTRFALSKPSEPGEQQAEGSNQHAHMVVKPSDTHAEPHLNFLAKDVLGHAGGGVLAGKGVLRGG